MIDELEPIEPTGGPVIESTKDDRTLALFCHLGSILGGFLLPLIIWLVKKDQSRFVDDQGKEALNFNLTLMLGHVVGGATVCFTFGLINLAVWVVGLVFSILAAVESNKGVAYRYPLTIRFIR